jgi:pSer/pThr/pTyr-binding forkhead associated (FHA) protein
VAPVLVKGKREPLDLYTILEDTSTGTMVAMTPFTKLAGAIALQLTYGDRTWTVGPDCPAVAIGRDASNDVVVRDQFASRHHARVY